MTKALEKAFEAASRLPAREQDELAAAILEELDAGATPGPGSHLGPDLRTLSDPLSNEALEEHGAGRTGAP